MRIRLAFCLTVLLSGILEDGISQIYSSDSSPNSNYNDSIYNNPDIGIRLIAPDYWKFTMDMDYPMIDIIGYRESESFSPNFNIISEQLSRQRNILTVLDLAEKMLKSELISFYLISKHLIKIDGIVCGEIVYDFYSYNSGYIRQKQLCIKTNTHYVKITFANLRGNYFEGQADFDKIQSSIKIDRTSDGNSQLKTKKPYHYIPIESISLSSSRVTLRGKNDSVRIKAFMHPGNANPDIYWTTDYNFLKFSSHTDTVITIRALENYKGNLIVMSRVHPNIQCICKIKTIIPVE